MSDFAVPTLPMRSSADTRAFYEKLGFVCAHEQVSPDSFLFMIRGGIRLQFFEAPWLDASIQDHSCYFYVEDLNATYRAFAAAETGKLMPIENKPWGMPEFVLIDLNGNLIRVGSPRLAM